MTSPAFQDSATCRALAEPEVIIISDDEEPPIEKVSDDKRFSAEYSGQVRELVYVAKQNQQGWVNHLLNEIDSTLKTFDGEYDLAGLSLTGWDADTHELIVIGMRRRRYLSLSYLTQVFDHLSQERECFFRKSTYVVKLKIANIDKDVARRRLVEATHAFRERCRLKKSVLTVHSTARDIDNLTRAIFVGKDCQKRKSRLNMNISSDSTQDLLKESNELQGSPEMTDKDSLADAFRRFDRYFRKEFTISVFIGLDGRDVLLESLEPPLRGRPNLDIVTDLREFHVVTSVDTAFSSGQCKNYCRACRVTYRIQSDHDCLVCCSHCRRVGVCARGSKKKCGNCNRRFASDQCFKRHQEENCERSDKKNTCSILKECRDCHKTYHTEGKRKKHSCDTKFFEKSIAVRPLKHSCRPTAIKQEEERRNVGEGTVVRNGANPAPVPNNLLSSNVPVAHSLVDSSAASGHVQGTSDDSNLGMISVESGKNKKITAGNVPVTSHTPHSINPIAPGPHNRKDHSSLAVSRKSKPHSDNGSETSHRRTAQVSCLRDTSLNSAGQDASVGLQSIKPTLSVDGGCRITQPTNQSQRTPQLASTAMDWSHSIPAPSSASKFPAQTPVAPGNASAAASPPSAATICNIHTRLAATSTARADAPRSYHDQQHSQSVTTRMLGGDAMGFQEPPTSASLGSDQPIPVRAVFIPSTQKLEVFIPWMRGEPNV